MQYLESSAQIMITVQVYSHFSSFGLHQLVRKKLYVIGSIGPFVLSIINKSLTLSPALVLLDLSADLV